MNIFEDESLPAIDERQNFIAQSSKRLWLREVSRIQRFAGEESMIHRVDLFVHLRRVAVMTKNLYPLLDPDMQQKRISKLFRMAYHHDDPEIGTGDIPSNIKMQMTDEQKSNLENEELVWQGRIADFIYHFTDSRDRELYTEEQQEIHEKSTEDSQFVDIVDKLDGVGEVMHELYCGNSNFLPIFDNYRKRFETFADRDLWKRIKSHGAIGMSVFPSNDIFPKEPIITPERVKEMASLWEVGRLPNLHSWYRSWIGITTQEFDLGRAKFMFPGWPQVWNRQEEPPVRTTLQGIVLPK